MPIICTSNPSSDHTYSLTNEQLDGSSESSVGDDECILSDVDDDFDADDLEDDDDVNKESDGDDELIDEEVDDEEGFDEEEMQQTVPPDDKSIFDFGKFVQRRSCPASDRLKICDTKSKGVLTRGMVTRLVAEQKTSTTKQQRSRKHGSSDSQDDETQKTFEGADALLNLASIGLLSLFQSAVSAADDSQRSDTAVSTPPSSPADTSTEDVLGNNNNNNNSVELKPVKQESPDDDSVDTSTAVVKEEPMDDS